MVTLSFDVGSNSVGSTWYDSDTGALTTGVSIFPAGVDESDEKRGDPKNVKRRMARRTRITLARREQRKRQLRLKLIAEGLLPSDPNEFKTLLERTDPWVLRSEALDRAIESHEFGRVLLHLAQRRGAMGLKIVEEDEKNDGEDGKVKAAIANVRMKMREINAPTFGVLITKLRADAAHVSPIVTKDNRPLRARTGPREFRAPVRNRAGSYEHCADRQMIREEFAKLWDAQKRHGGSVAHLLTETLRQALDDETGDSTWRHKGLLFGQRRQSWDLGTLGRCVLEPTERCVPHADMHASRFRVVETVNNLKIQERGKEERALTSEERTKVLSYLSGPLGVQKIGKNKGSAKQKVNVGDLRELMGWPRVPGKTPPFRFNIESDEDREPNDDWFSREIIHGAVTQEKWNTLPSSVREGLNRAILKHDPDDPKDADALKKGVMTWAALGESQADALVRAWQRRPKLDAKRLSISRRAVRNLLSLMDRDEPWNDPNRPGQHCWLTENQARKLIAEDGDFRDVSTGLPLTPEARRRYATGARGSTAADRHYMNKHSLKNADGEPILDENDKPVSQPPPAPLISNPVVRKAIHEVRRHLIEYLVTFERKPDYVYIELSREARMGKKDADAVLLRNRLRNRIRKDIGDKLDVYSESSTQVRAAEDRVILCVQQGGICALCGNQLARQKITTRMASAGKDCEVAHIIPRSKGGHNGLGNIVLAHTKCNRDMGNSTPRQFWEKMFRGGFEEGLRYVEGIYRNASRPRPSEVKSAEGDPLWEAYFFGRPRRFGPTFDELKIEQFKKEITDAQVQAMTNRQDAATKYASRQIMAYLADALFQGKGLPERGGERKIFASDGMWTARFRREWGLFFDPHHAKVHNIPATEEHIRREKNRGDHHHHAIDAVAIACSSRERQLEWERREKRAEAEGLNTVDEVQMENYRRSHPLTLPAPFSTRENFRGAVQRSVFGDGASVRPICHRPVKRKLIGALHEETLLGPALDDAGKLTDNFTAKKNVLALDPNHLRMPALETNDQAIERLARRRIKVAGIDEKTARKWARQVVASGGFTPTKVDPSPGKSGIVRDVALRQRLRDCLTDAGVNPDDFSALQVKKLAEAGGFRHRSEVPIKSVVLLRTMTDPVLTSRWATDHATGKRFKVFDAATGRGAPAAARAYVGGNNHHIEIRVMGDAAVKEIWSGEIVTAYEASQRKLARLRAFRMAGIPTGRALRAARPNERTQYKEALQRIELAQSPVDRRDNDEKGGRFVMSLCEGETLWMKHKKSGETGYFVVAKLDKPRSIVLVPHWDARSATPRKDSGGQKVPDSQREQFAITPGDLKTLAPLDRPHAVKCRVSPLGVITELLRD